MERCAERWRRPAGSFVTRQPWEFLLPGKKLELCDVESCIVWLGGLVECSVCCVFVFFLCVAALLCCCGYAARVLLFLRLALTEFRRRYHVLCATAGAGFPFLQPFTLLL